MKKYFLYFKFLFSVFSADAQTTWIYQAHRQCLEDELPCECLHLRLTIQADTLTSSAMIGYDDPGYADLRRMAPGEYGVLDLLQREGQEDSIVIYATLRFKGDTIFYYDGFTDFIMLKQYDTSRTYLDYLNAALIKRNYLPLEKTLSEDSLLCTCHVDAGITIIHGGDKHWSIERGKRDLNTLYLYELLNFPEGKVIYSVTNERTGKTKSIYKLKKKKIAAYPWVYTLQQ